METVMCFHQTHSSHQDGDVNETKRRVRNRAAFLLYSKLILIYLKFTMQEEITITTSAKETSELGQQIAKNLKGGEILCLTGELGAGKTTFTQGLLHELGAQGPYTSPTFVVIKNYKSNLKFKISNLKLLDIYHIDAYRIGANDLLELGFNDFAGKANAITIIEWPENIESILDSKATWIKFEWLDENQRKITFTKN